MRENRRRRQGGRERGASIYRIKINNTNNKGGKLQKTREQKKFKEKSEDTALTKQYFKNYIRAGPWHSR